MVNYRVAELRLRRDTGLLLVDARGLWTELTPGQDEIQKMLDLRGPRVMAPVVKNLPPLSRRTMDLAGGVEESVEAGGGAGMVEPPVSPPGTPGSNPNIVTPEEDPAPTPSDVPPDEAPGDHRINNP